MISAACSLVRLLVVLLAGWLPAQFVPDVVTYLGVSGTSHQTQWNLLSGQGYRPIALCVAGNRTTPYYSAVWIRRTGGFVGIHGVDRATYENWAATQAAAGWRPQLIASAGSAGQEVFAGVYANDGVEAVEVTNQGSYLESRNNWARDNNYVPTCVSRWNTASSPYYSIVYERPAARSFGAIRGYSAAELQAASDAHTSAFQRIHGMLQGTATQDYVGVWRDDRIGDWLCLTDQTLAQAQAEITNRRPSGFYPISVSQNGTGTAARFSLVFATRDRLPARTLQRTGLAVVGMQGFDDYMEEHILAHGIRQAAIAVTKHGRLVYARGYTFAEPGFALTEPTAMFRIASSSKPITGFLTHLLYQRGGTITPTTPAGSYLGLSGTDPDWSLIQVQHLIQHRSGLPSDMNSYSVALFLNQNSPTLPVSSWANALYAASRTVSPTPGTGSAYSNLGYYVLAEVIARASGKTYERFLREDLGAPLGVSRLYVSGSLATQRRLGEVQHHNRDLLVTQSQLHTDRRLVPIQYGGDGDDNLLRRAGAGGVLTSPVDYVRILAGVFDMACDGGPFTPATAETMLAAPSAGNTTLAGFDSRTVRANGVIAHSKNGMLWGSSTRVIYRSDGVAIAVFDNLANNVPSDARLNDAADAVVDWPTHDLFPQYGLPSFVRRCPRIDSIDRLSLPNVTDTFLTVTGDVLGGVDRAMIGSTAVTSLSATTWSAGWIRRIDDQHLEVHIPQGMLPGTYDLELRDGIFRSRSVPITITRAATRMLGGPAQAPFGYELVASRGGSSSNAMVYLGFSQSNAPSVIPGTVSLGLGNAFTDLGTAGPFSFNFLTGAVRFQIPDLGPNRWHFQVAVFDPNAINPFPLPVTNVRSVQGY